MRPHFGLVLVVVSVAAATLFTALPGQERANASGIIEISAGDTSTCALLADGTVSCWGSQGVSGSNAAADVRHPQQVCSDSTCGAPLGDVIDLDVGGSHACAVLTSGDLRCWGFNFYRQLAEGTTGSRAAPVAVCADKECSAHLEGIISVAAGTNHTCALRDTGGVYCWGANLAGQTGVGHGISPVAAPMTVCESAGCDEALTEVAALSAGGPSIDNGNTSCALNGDGGVLCWGATGLSVHERPVLMPGMESGVREVSAGAGQICGLYDDGSVACWGYHAGEQDVDGETCTDFCAVPVDGLENIEHISSGGGHSCAITSDGGVRCWGQNGAGQLGDGTTTNRSNAVDVGVIDAPVTAIAAGGQHTCAVTTRGEIWCWGANARGQLADGTLRSRLLPIPIAGKKPIPTSTPCAGEPCPTEVPTRTPSPTPTGYFVTGGVCEFPSGFCGAMRGAQVTLEPLGWTTMSSLCCAGFVFENVPDGDYTVQVNGCNPFGCWKPTHISVEGDDVFGVTIRMNGFDPTPTRTAVTTRTPEQTATPVPVPGDANCNGHVTSVDASPVLQVTAGIWEGGLCLWLADLNADCYTDAVDAALILQISAGLLSQPPFEPVVCPA